MHSVNKSLVALFLAAAPALAQNWPSFRGPNGQGVGTGNPPLTWNVGTGENIRWKTRIPGLGHSSPIVWGDRVFVTTAVSAAMDTPELTTGWLGGSGDPANDVGEWTWKLLCLDKATGRLLWEKDAAKGVPKVKRHAKATHANCTPATDGKHVVAFFGSEGMHCYDFDGKLLWTKDLGLLEVGPDGGGGMHWGSANSPIIHDGKILIQCDALNTGFWAAFNVSGGEEIRRVKRGDVSTWCTPAVLEHGGRTQLICNGWKEMAGYDLESGERLWTLHGGGDVPVPTPQVAQGMIFLTNGHGRSPIYAIRADARGDLTPAADSDSASPPPGMAWWKRGWGSYMPTPLVLDGLLYVASDNGIVTVMDARTGEKKYRQRLENAGTFSASIVAVKDRLYFANEDGEVFILKAGPAFELLGKNAMAEICMATPAISDGLLLIRGRDNLYGIGR